MITANEEIKKSSEGVIYDVKCRVDHYHAPVHNNEGKLVPWLIDVSGPFHSILTKAARWWFGVPERDGWPLWCSAAKLARDYEQRGGAVPASTCSMAIQAFLRYYAYCGDPRALQLAISAGEYIIQQALTPREMNAWPRFAWPAGKTGDIHPDGSGHPHCSAGEIMPDKGAMAGYALSQLYKAAGDKIVKSAAISARRYN